MNRARSYWATCAMLVVMLSFAVAPCCVQAQTDEPPIEHSYQLIYAPLDKIAELTPDELRTMRRERFFSLVEEAFQPTPPHLNGDAFLQRATYRARLEDDQLVDGSAILEVVSAREQPVHLPMGPINIAIDSARWTRPSDRPAVLGAEPDGDVVLMAPESGTLNFNWSRRADAVEADDLSFHLRFPTCPVNRLELVLPSDYTLHSSHGVPIRTELDPPDGRDGSTSGESLWQIELGGNCDLKLRIRPAATDVPRVQLRQLSTYDISAYGIGLTVDLRLDCGDEAMEQLGIQVDGRLRLTRVQLGTESLSWSVVSSRAGQPTSVLIEFEEPLRGNNRAVSLVAIAPVTLNGSYALPRIRPQAVDWQQEDARIHIERPFAVRELTLENARQLPFADSDDPAQQVPLDIQFLEPEGNITLEVESLPARYAFNSGVSAVVSDEQATAEVRLDVRPDTDRLFEIDAEVLDGWTVEAVESTPGDLIHDWKVEVTDGSSRLKISFRHPLSTSEETILMVRATRRWDRAATLIRQSQLRPLRLTGAATPVRQFLVIHPDEESVANVEGDRRVTWLTLDDLDTIEAQLTDATETDSIVLLDGNEDQLSVRLSRVPRAERPFSASLQVTSLVTAPYVHEMIRVELDRLPPSPPLRIRLSHARESSIRWMNASDPQRPLSAWHEPSANGQGEIWHIDTPETTKTPIVITGERYYPPEDELPLTLVRVEGAKTQDGVLLIEASSELDLAVRHSRRLTPTPLYRSGFQQVSRMRKAFRYDPSADLLAEAEPLVVSVLPESDGISRTHVWDAKLETHLDQSGIMRCELALQVENRGGADLSFELQPDWNVRKVLVDNREVSIRAPTDNVLLIALPATRRFLYVRVNFEVKGRPLRVWQRVPAIRPRLNVPVLSERRMFWTPPEFSIGLAHQREQSSIRSCFRRLLGPLLRPAETPPFSLFSRQS